MIKIKHLVFDYLSSVISDETTAKYVTVFLLSVVLVFLLWGVRFVVRRLIINAFNKFSEKTKTNFDDILVSNKVPRKIASLIPLYIAYNIIPVIFEDFIHEKSVTQKTVEVVGILFSLWIIQSIINSFGDYLKTLKNFKDKPIDSYGQVFSILIWLIGILSIFVTITGIPFIKFLTTLGAASAVFIFIFKDVILGFIASIQVSINNMIRIGDWITFDKYGADGDVIEINLVSVKIKNFDLTITTIPTYALTSESFQNWRGMKESKGRRIKRALYIKQNSVKYLSESLLNKLKDIQLLTTYLDNKTKDIRKYNSENSVNKEILINGRNLTNLGVFRKWIDEYLKNHSGVNKEMMIMVRQLAPTTQGIPIEVYCFSVDKKWENYEYIMSDIFDHIIPALPYFELELFELPSNFKIARDGYK